MIELLVQNLQRLDESESADNQGVFNTLGTIQFLCFCSSIKRDELHLLCGLYSIFCNNVFIFLCLGVIENLTSLDPSISERVLKETDLLQWILTRIKVKVFDSNRQYASEILAILLQDSRGNYQSFIRYFGGVWVGSRCDVATA